MTIDLQGSIGWPDWNKNTLFQCFCGYVSFQVWLFHTKLAHTWLFFPFVCLFCIYNEINSSNVVMQKKRRHICFVVLY